MDPDLSDDRGLDELNVKLQSHNVEFCVLSNHYSSIQEMTRQEEDIQK